MHAFLLCLIHLYITLFFFRHNLFISLNKCVFDHLQMWVCVCERVSEEGDAISTFDLFICSVSVCFSSNWFLPRFFLPIPNTRKTILIRFRARIFPLAIDFWKHLLIFVMHLIKSIHFKKFKSTKTKKQTEQNTSWWLRKRITQNIGFVYRVRSSERWPSDWRSRSNQLFLSVSI